MRGRYLVGGGFLVLGGTLYALDGPLWVNHPLRNAAADYKPAQLAVAQRLGLTVPPTLVTNDPDEARSFVDSHDQAIFKTLGWTPYQRGGVPLTGWAEFTENADTWTVRQGGPIALWDTIEQALTAWQDADRPDITEVRLRVTKEAHVYWIDGHPALRWQHDLV